MTEEELLLKIKTEADASGLDSLTGKLGGFGDKLGGISKAAGAGLLAGTAAAVGFGAAAVAAASDVAESQNKVNVVFGESAGAINDLAETAAAKLGMTKGEVLGAAGGVGNLLTAMGQGKKEAADLSVGMVKLAADLGSFNNASSEEVLQAMTAAMAGETDGMKKYGVAINEVTLKQAAIKAGLGDNVQALSAAEKQQLAYNIMMEQTKAAQGDFANTSGGVANGMKIIKASLGQVVADLGAGLIPAVEKAGQGLATFLQSDKFEELKGKLMDGFAAIGDKLAAIDWGKVSDAVIGIATKIGDIFTWLSENPAITKIALVIGGLVAAFAPVAAIIAPIVSVVGSLIGLLGGGSAIIGGLTTAFTFLVGILGGPVTIAIGVLIGLWALWQAKGDEIKEWLAGLGDFIAAKWEEIKGWIGAAIDAISAYMAVVWQGIKDYLVAKLTEIGTNISDAWTAIKDTITERIEAARVMISAKWDAIKEYLDAKLQQISAAIAIIWQGIKDKIADFLGGILETVTNKWEEIKATTEAKLEAAKAAVMVIWEGIKQYIAEKIAAVAADVSAKWEEIKATAQAKLAEMADAVRQKFEDIKSRVSQAWEDIKRLFHDAWEGLKRIINWDELKAKFEAGKAALMAAGKQIVEGLKQGISDAWESLKAWFGEKIRGLLGDIKGLLGIKSPSSVFAEEVGEPIGEGIIQGLRRSLEANPATEIIGGWANKAISQAPQLITPMISAAIGGALAAGLILAVQKGGMAGAMSKALSFGGSLGGLDSILRDVDANPFNRTGRVGIQTKLGEGGGDATGVRADAFRSGRGGQLAASKSNYWKVFVSKWGVPTEASARKVARQLGIPLPQWLEDIYNPPASDSAVDPMDPMKDALEPAAAVGEAMKQAAAAIEEAAGKIKAAAIHIELDNLKNAVGRAVPPFEALIPILEPIAKGGGIGPGTGGPIVIEPPPGGEVKVDRIELGNIVTGPTHVYLDSREIARGVAKSFVEDVTILDQLGKALGKRKAQTT